MPSKHARAARVERGDPYMLRSEADQIVDAPSHLLSSLVGKCYRHYPPWLDMFFLYKIGDPVGKSLRLARSGTGKYQHRTFR